MLDAPDKSQAAFTQWVRRLVTGTAELKAFDAGEIDAVMDRDSGSAVLLPEAQSALHDSNRIALSALDALPGEVCVLDSNGVVVMTNKAWRVAGAAHERAGLDVRAGENIFVACGDVPESEREYATEVSDGVRQVLTRMRQSLNCRYVCHAARTRPQCTFTIAGIAGDGPVTAIVTREWKSESPRPRTRRARPRNARARVPAVQAASKEPPARLTASRGLCAHDERLRARRATYGKVLYEPGDPMDAVYFPGNSLVSLLTLVEGHRALEVGLVGREGMIGARLALGAATSSVRALVQGTGTAMRMSSARFLREIRPQPGAAASAVQVHRHADDPDQPDRGLQSFSHRGSAAGTVAADDRRAHGFAGVSPDA